MNPKLKDIILSHQRGESPQNKRKRAKEKGVMYKAITAQQERAIQHTRNTQQAATRISTRKNRKDQQQERQTDKAERNRIRLQDDRRTSTQEQEHNKGSQQQLQRLFIL